MTTYFTGHPGVGKCTLWLYANIEHCNVSNNIIDNIFNIVNKVAIQYSKTLKHNSKPHQIILDWVNVHYVHTLLDVGGENWPPKEMEET